MKAPKAVMDVIEQQEFQARDGEGRRWVKCQFCGEVKLADDFVCYGGIDRVNLGRCSSCGWDVK